MGTLQSSPAVTSLTQLRDAIRKLEVGVANPKGRGAGIIDLFKLRDETELGLGMLASERADLRAEMTRLETVDAGLRRRAPVILRELRRAGGLAAAREREQPPTAHWWWYLDITYTEERRRRLKRSLLTVLALVVIIGGGIYTVERVWGLSPVERQARQHVATAENYLAQGEIDAAIDEYQQATAVQPDFAEPYTYLAALYDIQGREDEAQQAYATAEKLYEDPILSQEELAQAYLMLGRPDKVYETVDRILEQDPESMRAYYIRAGAYEIQDDGENALADLERAADLAHEQGNEALYVLAKTRIGNLLQKMGAQIGP